MGWHWTYGYLRRPELDQIMVTSEGLKEPCYCYEEPDGDQVYSPYKSHKKRAHMVCRKDEETGEKYLSFSRLMPFEQIMESGRDGHE